MGNLYVHFPFCRRKCSYCALYSRVGVSEADREAYVRQLVSRLTTADGRRTTLKTIYFGGGSPALCDLGPLGPALRPLLGPDTEFTVELHPLDVTPAKLDELKEIGVNRISMGVQSFDDATLAAMGRGYTLAEAERAFARVKSRFDNAGIDLIVGYPGDEAEVEGGAWRIGLERFAEMGLRHCSVYSLQNERGLKNVPDDDSVMDSLRHLAICLQSLGLERYEISNYAVPGFECRHNFAVWRGEDYVGLGDGAYGRVGLTRPRVFSARGDNSGQTAFFMEKVEKVTAEADRKERTLFRLRTRDGLDSSDYPEWWPVLARFVQEGLLTCEGSVYRLTDRGTEVCDSILAELV